jgi:hypothetical protein
MMGSPDTEYGHDANEEPLHKVHINYTFAAGKFPVTRALAPADRDEPPPTIRRAAAPAAIAAMLPARHACLGALAG